MAAVVPGWLAVLGGYRLLLPLFGVLSPVTWFTIWAGWLWAIGAPGAVAIWLTRNRRWWQAGGIVAVAVLAGAGLYMVGPPQRTPEGQWREHRSELARLAGDYRAGRIRGDVDLPWHLRSTSIDGKAHPRCGLTDPTTGRKECALYLPAWQDWRAESGMGFAYYPATPGQYASITTADGDDGTPSRALGDGWWWVE